MSDQQIMTAGDLSGDVRSDVFRCDKGELACITIDANDDVADAVGDFELQRSFDYDPARPTLATWVPVGAGVTVLALAGASARYSQEYRGLVGWYSVFYDSTSDGTADSADVYLARSSVR